MQRLLENRVKYFFSSRHRGREDVRRALRELRRHGRLVLIGGMLRDLALFGNAEFASDLDFVIAPYNLAKFEAHMKSIGAQTNRFGGYALPGHRWQIDVWPLERTWAHVNGHTSVRTVGDLRRATFFRCDAITYDIDSKRLNTANGYFRDLEERVLEINLRPNPNPTGNAVRAFRYSLIKGFRWGPELAQFVDETVAARGWRALLESEFRSYRSRHLESVRIDELMTALRRHLTSGATAPFFPLNHCNGTQLDLPHIN